MAFLSQGTKFKLYQFLKSVSENETFVEDQRQMLGRQEDFEPYAAFRRICACSEDPTQNVINAADFCRFLRYVQLCFQ